MAIPARPTLSVGNARFTRVDLMSSAYAELPLLAYTPGSVGHTFTRASAAAYRDADGAFKTVGVDVLRDAHFVGAERTTLLEGQRTNLYPVSEPTIASLTDSGVTDAAGFGVFGGSIQYPATASQGFGYWGGLCSPNTQYAFSMFVQMDDGAAPAPGTTTTSGDFVLIIAGSIVTDAPRVQQVAGSVYRIVGVRTTPGSISANNTGILRNSTHSGRGFRVSGYQLEAAAFASSYVPTAGTPTTRAADALSWSDTWVEQETTRYWRYYDLATAAWVDAVDVATRSAPDALTTDALRYRAYSHLLYLGGSWTLTAARAAAGVS